MARKTKTKPEAASTAIEQEDAEAGRLLAEGLTGPRADLADLPPVALDLPAGRLVPSPLNPRRRSDPAELAELAASIVANGVLQALLVRPFRVDGRATEHYEVICGARRLAAIALAVAEKRLPAEYAVPVRVRECTDQELVVLAATENLARKDMEPLEEAEVFASLLKHVERRDGEATKEAAVARVLGTSERTVFRRLQLLRLAEPVKAALGRREINLQQAAALSLGEEKAQKGALKEIKSGDSYWSQPLRIRELMTRERIPVERALFSPKLYTGEIVEDEESGRRYFADSEEFGRLQAASLEDWIAELSEKYAWVDDLTENGRDRFGYMECKKSDPDAGAIIVADRNGRPTLQAPMVRPAIVEARNRKARDEKRSSRGLPDRSERRPLTEAQNVATRNAKTAALRRGVADNPRAALALGIMGLLGISEIRLGSFSHWIPQQDHAYRTRDWELELIRTRLSAVGKKAPTRVDGTLALKAGDEAELFRALLQLQVETLLGIQASLIARRVGSWFDPAPGDTPLCVAVAEAVDAATWLKGEWEPGEEYFKGYSRDRLVEIVRAHLGRHDANKLKKGELVAACAKLKAFWKPERFVELRFLEEKAMAKALAEPVTAPATADAAE